jgi:hypothetical protein
MQLASHKAKDAKTRPLDLVDGLRALGRGRTLADAVGPESVAACPKLTTAGWTDDEAHRPVCGGRRA